MQEYFLQKNAHISLYQTVKHSMINRLLLNRIARISYYVKRLYDFILALNLFIIKNHILFVFV